MQTARHKKVKGKRKNQKHQHPPYFIKSPNHRVVPNVIRDERSEQESDREIEKFKMQVS